MFQKKIILINFERHINDNLFFATLLVKLL